MPGRQRDALRAARARRDGGGRLRPASCRHGCWSCRDWAASTSMPRCCRAGAAQRRSSARSRPATPTPASRSCRWTRGSTPATCCSSKPSPIAPDDSSVDAARQARRDRRPPDRRCTAARRRRRTVAARRSRAEGVTYAHKIDKSEGAIDWSAPATSIERRLRAFDPFPGATQPARRRGGQAVARRTVRRRASGAPGEVAPDLRRAASSSPAANGRCRLTELQRPGGRRVPASRFLAGPPDRAGPAL